MLSGDTPIPRKVAVYLVYVEKYALPVLYVFLGWRQIGIIRQRFADYAVQNAAHAPSAVARSLFAVGTIRQFLLLTIVVFYGSMLLLSHAPTVLPGKLKHVLLPLAMSFYFVLYTTVDNYPLLLRQNVMPQDWQLPLGVAGALLSIGGYSLALWAVSYLRRAFGLFVSVRRVVLGGPYVYVRHPIYAGYFLNTLGLLAANGSLAMLVLCTGFMVLTVYRARLEEEKLGEASEEYALYRQKTGFLFPRLH